MTTNNTNTARIFFTDAVTTDALEIVKVRVTEQVGSGGWLVELMVGDYVIEQETETVQYLNNAFILGRAMIEHYLKDPLSKLMYSTETSIDDNGREIQAIVVDKEGAPGWMVYVLRDREIIGEVCVSDDIDYAEEVANKEVQNVLAGDDKETEIDAPAQPEPASEVIYTDPITTADGETITARVTQRGEHDYLIELLINDVVDHGVSEIGSTQRYAMLRANDLVAKRKIAVDSPFNPRRHKTLTPVATISLKTGRLIEATEDIKAQRAAYLRQQIERTESELASLRFELSELE